MRGPGLTTLLDLLALACFAALAFAAWPPLCLGVFGVAALLISRKAVRP
jgi:hypothetical protein